MVTIMEKIRFGDIRRFISVTDRVSICNYETLCYENFESIGRVPCTYNEKYLYGLRVIESEFENNLEICIEITVSE